VSRVVHLELHTGDGPSACAQYEQLLGWRARPVGRVRPYLALELARGLGGGIVECGTRRPVWVPYVEVADVGALTERAAGLGASVLLEPRDGPAGRRSVVSVPDGGEIALWQPRR
jgi:predicted enzyme related to lactoylglutathione lyase